MPVPSVSSRFLLFRLTYLCFRSFCFANPIAQAREKDVSPNKTLEYADRSNEGRNSYECEYAVGTYKGAHGAAG